MSGTEDPHLARWNQRFSAEDYVFGTAPNAFLAAHAPLLRPGMKALAVADGEGRNGVFLAERGLDVLAVDFSPVALAKAQRLAAARGVRMRTERADLATWDWGGPRFDLVAAIFIQFAGPELRPLLFRRLREVLVPGGLLILQGYRPEQIGHGTGGPSSPENLYTEAMLREAFAGMEILELAAEDRVIEEGAGHRGLSALIGMVARAPGARYPGQGSE